MTAVDGERLLRENAELRASNARLTGQLEKLTEQVEKLTERVAELLAVAQRRQRKPTESAV